MNHYRISKRQQEAETEGMSNKAKQTNVQIIMTGKVCITTRRISIMKEKYEKSYSWIIIEFSYINMR